MDRIVPAREREVPVESERTSSSIAHGLATPLLAVPKRVEEGLAGAAGDAAAVDHLAVGGAELEFGAAGLEDDSESARHATAAEGQTPIAGQARPVAPARTRHVLRQAVAATEALQVVLMTIHHQTRAPPEGIPKRRNVGGVSMRRAGAEAGPVPVGEPAGAGFAQLATQPAQLVRARAVGGLGVQADQLPATEPEAVPVRLAPSLRLAPVGQVASPTRDPVVVADGGLRDVVQLAVDGRVVVGEVARAPWG